MLEAYLSIWKKHLFQLFLIELTWPSSYTLWESALQPLIDIPCPRGASLKKDHIIDPADGFLYLQLWYCGWCLTVTSRICLRDPTSQRPMSHYITSNGFRKLFLTKPPVPCSTVELSPTLWSLIVHTKTSHVAGTHSSIGKHHRHLEKACAKHLSLRWTVVPSAQRIVHYWGGTPDMLLLSTEAVDAFETFRFHDKWQLGRLRDSQTSVESGAHRWSRNVFTSSGPGRSHQIYDAGERLTSSATSTCNKFGVTVLKKRNSHFLWRCDCHICCERRARSGCIVVVSQTWQRTRQRQNLAYHDPNHTRLPASPAKPPTRPLFNQLFIHTLVRLSEDAADEFGFGVRGNSLPPPNSTPLTKKKTKKKKKN